MRSKLLWKSTEENYCKQWPLLKRRCCHSGIFIRTRRHFLITTTTTTTKENSTTCFGFTLFARVLLDKMLSLAPTGSLQLGKLELTNLIGLLKSDWQIVCPVTFQIPSPLPKRFLWALDQMDTWDKSGRFRGASFVSLSCQWYCALNFPHTKVWLCRRLSFWHVWLSRVFSEARSVPCLFIYTDCCQKNASVWNRAACWFYTQLFIASFCFCFLSQSNLTVTYIQALWCWTSP